MIGMKGDGWLVIHQDNFKIDNQIFLLTFEEIADKLFVFNSMYCRSIGCTL